MKLAVVSESGDDEAAVRILVEAILDTDVELVRPPQRRRGWPAVHRVLSGALKYLRYQRPDVEGLVVVVDSNSTPIETPANADRDSMSRIDLLRDEIARVNDQMAHQGGLRIRTAVGLAVPAIEAWYLCGSDPRAYEAVWRQFLQNDPDSEQIRQWKVALKTSAYGDTATSQQVRLAKATAAVSRIAKDIGSLREHFPVGFGALEHDLAQW